MKHFLHFAALIFLCLGGVQGKAQIIQTSPFTIDTNQYRIDSVFNTVTIQGKLYTIIILRDRYTTSMMPYNTSADLIEFVSEQSPITLLIVDKEKGSIKYHYKFLANLNDYPFLNWQLLKGQERQLNQPGKLFFSIDKSYGGSGSMNSTFLIDTAKNGLQMMNLFKTTGELSDFILSKNEQELYLIEGIWNSSENEQHFSNHRYRIKKIRFIKNEVQTYTLGITKFKYPCIDEEYSAETILHLISRKEKKFANMFSTDY